MDQPQPMTCDSDRDDASDPSEAAVYLILRDELKWRNVFRLTPGQVTTIGRAPTNRVVIPDDICSRHHCEVFQVGGDWVLRDLESRNGTLIEGKRVTRDRTLADGDEIQVGEFFLIFTHNLTRPDGGDFDLEDNTGTYEGRSPAGSPEPEILYRRQRTRFLSQELGETGSRDRTSQELASLYRMALEMGAARDARQLADLVLEGLFNAIQVDIGAILLLPKDIERPSAGQLRIAAYRTRDNETYEKVSTSLSGLVLANREAVLARDISEDSRLASTGSLEKLRARSVICAPLRTADGILGVMHLYTTHGGRTLGVEDLEYALAVADQFAIAHQNVLEKENLQDGLARAQDEAEILRNQLAIESDLVGSSPAMLNLRDTISRIAPTDATVLIRGESGVGKELVARAIHFSSECRNGPFVCMNCAALSETLLESELFGHEKGSFTGAANRKIGKFEQAHRGTLFLDEVGEMSLAIQAKFLRVLEGHPFERVGGGTPIQVDVRVVAATNRDLEKAIEQKLFRQDLFFRLFVVEIAVPPLRERPTDIPVLANYFLKKFAARSSRRVEGWSPRALDILVSYEWPGNVRELQNTVERAVILSRGSIIEASDIQLSTRTATSAQVSVNAAIPEVRPAASADVSLEILERDHILTVLEKTNWNKSLAAQILGIERSTLDRKLKRYNVNRPRRSPEA